MVIGSIAAIGSSFYLDGLTSRVASALAAIHCATHGAYRLGVYYGFARDYQEGPEQGVHRVLGISPDEAQDIHERAIEMKTDEGLIGKLDERKNRPSALKCRRAAAWSACRFCAAQRRYATPGNKKPRNGGALRCFPRRPETS